MARWTSDRDHRGVDPARQRAQHPVGAHLRPDLRDRGVDEGRHGPRRAARRRPRGSSRGCVGPAGCGRPRDGTARRRAAARRRPWPPPGSCRWRRALAKPGGGCITVSPWLIHTVSRPSRSGVTPRRARSRPSSWTSAGPYSRRSAGTTRRPADSPWPACRSRCRGRACRPRRARGAAARPRRRRSTGPPDSTMPR